jgi:subtilisin
MRRTAILLAVMAMALVVASGLALAQTMPEARTIPLQTQPAGGKVIPGEYIVVLEDQPAGGFEARAAHVAQQMASHYAGLEVKRTYRHALEGFAAHIPQERLDEVKADPRVLFVSENREVRATFRQQVLPTGVDRIEADTSTTRASNGAGSVGVGIAVLDTGVARHPDLNVVGGKDCASTSNRPFRDEAGHGTHVAGTAAARDNGFGVVGVAPGAPIYSAKVLGKRGFGNVAGIVCGIDWVTSHSGEIEVANMSLGARFFDDENCGTENRDAMHYAICRSVDEGITYVVAAGNEARNFRSLTPASYDEVLTVTAMADSDGKPGGEGGRPSCEFERDDTADNFSNFATVGSDDAGHTIAAPGVCILSTFPGDSYRRGFSGTSMASPHVAGTAALYKAGHPNASPQQVMEALLAEAREQPPSYGFRGDPHRPIDNRYYGYLVHAGDF